MKVLQKAYKAINNKTATERGCRFVDKFTLCPKITAYRYALLIKGLGCNINISVIPHGNTVIDIYSFEHIYISERSECGLR